MFPYSTYACSTNCHFSPPPPPPPPLPPPSISFPPGCRSLFLRAKFTFRYRARAGWARLANPPMYVGDTDPERKVSKAIGHLWSWAGFMAAQLWAINFAKKCELHQYSADNNESICCPKCTFKLI